MIKNKTGKLFDTWVMSNSDGVKYTIKVYCKCHRDHYYQFNAIVNDSNGITLKTLDNLSSSSPSELHSSVQTEINKLAKIKWVPMLMVVVRKSHTVYGEQPICDIEFNYCITGFIGVFKYLKGMIGRKPVWTADNSNIKRGRPTINRYDRHRTLVYHYKDTIENRRLIDMMSIQSESMRR